MSFSLELVLWTLTAYLVGAIPSSVWVGKWFYKKDIREYGSKNAGATNTFRVLGPKAGIPVLIIDVFKGAGAVLIVYFQNEYAKGTTEFVNLMLIFGLAAVIGHIFPVYVGFRGGKGVATLLGVFAAIMPLAALASAGIFIFVFSITRYVSLGSMSAGIAFPFFVIFLFNYDHLALQIVSVV
ncbi:MAG: acyl-phosphate glycerol 3-phosphate acyltransferase, partial [Marinilabiliales bacterium]